MEIDSPDGSTGSIDGNQDSEFDLYPVPFNASGEGLPYAPINWPNPGDNWRWRTGKRRTASGHHLDRYLYPPKHLQLTKRRLASKPAVDQFLRSGFPNADVKAFFASFSWKIPYLHSTANGDDDEDVPSLWGATESSLSESPDGILVCKAGNKTCSSLVVGYSSAEVMSCDICCNEPGFCRDCCCILCCQTVSSAHGGYSYFRCEARVADFICGHVAHITCGLRAYLAGTVGGSIRLDAEYYCRRCDSKSDLVPHVSKFLQTCKSIGSRNDIEEVLSLGICILRGSERACARQLLHSVSLVMSEMKRGTDLEAIWKKEDLVAVTTAGQFHCENGNLKGSDFKYDLENKASNPQIFSSIFDQLTESLDLEDEIDKTLGELKKSQESEYQIAAVNLIAQRKYIQNLYQRLRDEKSHLSTDASADAETLLDTVLSRVEQVKGELAKFNHMKEVAKGFGRTPKHILREYFGIEHDN